MNIKVLLGMVALMIGLSVAQAQIGTAVPTGLAHDNLTTVTTPFLLEGSSTTNIPAAQARIFPVPVNGFGVYLRTGGTNSASTTNITVRLEGIIYGPAGAQAVDNVTLTISTPAVETVLPTGYDFFTNILTTSANVQNIDGFRVKSIQNTNLASIWLTNMFATRRPIP